MVSSANCDLRSRNDDLFTKILSCAYSLQQLHERMQLRLPAARFSVILTEVINTQALIRNRKLDPDNAMQLIASRTEKLIGAAGAAVAILHGEMLEYNLATGIAINLRGFRSRAQEIISFERLKSEPMAQMDAWQEKVLGGRVAANVLSVPVYRQGTLAGCIQFFSRHGHFDSDGRYACELMSGILSQVIEALPLSQAQAREESPGTVQVEEASVRGNESQSEPTAGAASNRAKLQWPGSNTRELEARLKKAAMSVNATDKLPKAAVGAESHNLSQPSARVPGQGADDREIQPRKQEKAIFSAKQDDDNWNPATVSGGGNVPGRSYGSLALVPSEAQAPRLVPSPALLNEESVKREPWNEPDPPDTVRDAPAKGLVHEGTGTAPNSHVRNGNVHIHSETWRRVARLLYPIFVLIFAIAVRIRAGRHNWLLEVTIYILLVLTTLEIQSRWSKR